MKLSKLTMIVVLLILGNRIAVGESVKLVFEAGFSDEFQAGNRWANVDEQDVKDYIISSVTQHFQGNFGISVSTTSGHLVAYIGRFESDPGFFGLSVTGTGSFVDTSPYAEIYSNNYAAWSEWQGSNATVTRIGNAIAGTTNHEIGHLLNCYHVYMSSFWDPTVAGTAGCKTAKWS